MTTSEITTTLEVGTQVHGLSSDYRLTAPLGQGGFGETFLAQARLRDAGPAEADEPAEVVLKFLRLDRLEDFKALELFEREAKALASLQHPGIPKTHAFFAWDGARAYAPDDLDALPTGQTLRWVMVQSRAPGRPLSERIAARERMPAPALESLMRRVLGILQYLHGLHPPVVHRDIKPGNLVVSDEGVVSLVDFGAIQDRVRAASTVASTSVGTFGYLPMEQMMGQARPASDLYALGVSVVVAATHRKPETLVIDDQSSKIDLDKLQLDLPPRLRAALDSMIEPIVGKRAPDVAHVLRILDGEAALAPSPGAALAVAPHDDGTLKHAALWNGAVGVGGLAAGLIYLVFFNSFSETALIQISALWVAPVAFGFFGKLAEKADRPNPIASGVLAAGVTIAALIVFIYGIFPAL